MAITFTAFVNLDNVNLYIYIYTAVQKFGKILLDLLFWRKKKYLQRELMH